MKVRVWRAAYNERVSVPELDVGFLVEKFNRPPWELGVTNVPDMGLLYRALDAVHVYRAAKKYQDDWAKNPHSISDDEWRTIAKVRKELMKQEADAASDES